MEMEETLENHDSNKQNTEIPMKKTKNVIKLKYEIFGKVQGVFFRKYTKKKADPLGIFGWVQNTVNNTVIGEIEGKSNDIQRMKNCCIYVW